jgi:tetratricopeptide (TPR) repeat protein
MSDNINMKNLPTNSEPGVPKNIPPELIPVYDWWIKDGKSTLVMVVIAAVIVGAFYGVKGWMKQRNADANAAVSQAYLSQSSAADLETAVAQFGSTKAGIPLKLRLAKEYYDTAAYDKALAIYDEIIAQKASAAAYADIAVVGRAYALEGLKRYDEARNDFASFIADNEKNYLYFTAKLGEARCRVLAKQGDKAALEKERTAVIAELEAFKKDKQGVEEARIDSLISVIKRFSPERFAENLKRAEDAAKNAGDLFKLADALDEKKVEEKAPAKEVKPEPAKEAPVQPKKEVPSKK